MIVLHAKEQHKPSNTGHLVPRLLSDAELQVALPEGDLPRPLPAGRQVLLFPHEEAIPLDRLPSSSERLVLVVPDAPWRQARRMATRWTSLRHLPRVRLPQAQSGRFGLRKTNVEEGLGTLEAVGRAMGVLECQFVEDRLLTALDRVVRRGLYARGRAPADEELRVDLERARARGLRW